MSLLTARQFMIDPGHEVANPLQPGPHRPVPLAGKRVLGQRCGRGSRSFRRAAGKVAGRRGDCAAAGRHEAFLRQLGADSVIDYTTTAVEETVRDWTRLLMRRAGRPAAVFAYPATRRRAVPDLSARLCRGGRGATARSDGLHHPGTLQRRAARPACRPAGRRGHRVAIDSVFPIAQAQMAHERAAQGHLEGKIVLSVMDSSAG